jgi:hypothetical protein
MLSNCILYLSGHKKGHNVFLDLQLCFPGRSGIASLAQTDEFIVANDTVIGLGRLIHQALTGIQDRKRSTLLRRKQDVRR